MGDGGLTFATISPMVILPLCIRKYCPFGYNKYKPLAICVRVSELQEFITLAASIASSAAVFGLSPIVMWDRFNAGTKVYAPPISVFPLVFLPILFGSGF
jgi:hypothetical protein